MNSIKTLFRTIMFSCVGIMYVAIFYRIFEYLLDARIGAGMGLTFITLLLTGFFYSFVSNWKNGK